MRKPGWPMMQGMGLLLEAQQVIVLRMMKLAMGGPDAQAETRRMVEEKIGAAGDAAVLLAAGAMRGDAAGGTADAMRMVRRTVRANRKRLIRGR